MDQLVAVFLVLLGLSIHASVHACLPNDASTTLERLMTTFVCLVVNDEHVTVTAPLADQYTRYVMEGSYAKSRSCVKPWGTNPDTSRRMLQNSTQSPTTSDDDCASNIYIESMGVKSIYKKEYTNEARDVYFPILTAIISVENGNIVSVFWDDGCWFCPGDPTPDQECYQNAYDASNELINYPQDSGQGWECGIKLAKCEAEESFCDLTIYVVWTGTDANGKYFGSAGSRFQRFTQYALPNMLDWMNNFLST